ncbi:hypothetical protein HOT31_gp103 [Microbacterium phage Hendrix]|uniref:Lipoprotein n=1 Tax=Microbacterium phage Hendrix TaxID=2182341 RepID=A0A2U8UUC3_9CAUD|nr:hypothetical protein HOT31_gp103 [Microbacterium phage Hendrix]AWN07774.1 hypothetical protein PBI_HENDRIX_103 [Microbacterium phage Hendrix]
MRAHGRSLILGTAALLAVVTLSGCSMEPPGPSPFQINCEEELNGTFLEDSATIEVQNVSVGGTITGGVYVNGTYTTGTGYGYGTYTGSTSVTARVCIVDGDIKDSEIL